MANCVTCSGHIKNTGLPSGDKPFGRIVGMYLVPLVASDGSANYLDTSLTGSALDAELLGKINNQDPSKRWYPILNLRNVEPTQEDSTFEEDNAGNRFKLMDGRSTMHAEIWGASRRYYAQLRDVCVDFGVVLIDECGNLLGEYDEANDRLYTRRANNKSYNSTYGNTTADATSKIIIEFDYDLTTSEADQIMLPISAFESVNPNKLNGMVDVKVEATPGSGGGSVDIKATTNFGMINNFIPWLGGDTANISINNITGGTVVTPTSVTSNGNGEYTIAYTGPTQGDDLSVVIFATATGNYEYGYEGESAQYTEL